MAPLASVLVGLSWAQFVSGAVAPEQWHGGELVAVGIVSLLLVGCFWRQREAVPHLLRDASGPATPC